MGLGKTLSMISPIAANQACLAPHEMHGYPKPVNMKATLLIVPPACMYKVKNHSALTNQYVYSDTSLGKAIFDVSHHAPWADALVFLLTMTRHLQHESLKIHIYHGQSRTAVEFLGHYDVIITTYHTVSAIFRKHSVQATHENSLFSLTWHRLILDEGKNSI
jgi:SWI/SNF-related matrix-associated actin-dependent regulator of chromatin subfamily A3